MAFGEIEINLVSDSTKKQEDKKNNFDVEMAIEIFEKKLISMHPDKRKEYLNSLNLNYNVITNLDEKLNKELIKISNIWDQLDIELQNNFIVEILLILGYDNTTGTEKKLELKTLKKNSKIISCIYPEIDFYKMLMFFNENEQKINFVMKCYELLNKYKEKNIETIEENFKKMAKKLI